MHPIRLCSGAWQLKRTIKALTCVSFASEPTRHDDSDGGNHWIATLFDDGSTTHCSMTSMQLWQLFQIRFYLRVFSTYVHCHERRWCFEQACVLAVCEWARQHWRDTISWLLSGRTACLIWFSVEGLGRKPGIWPRVVWHQRENDSSIHSHRKTAVVVAPSCLDFNVSKPTPLWFYHSIAHSRLLQLASKSVADHNCLISSGRQIISAIITRHDSIFTSLSNLI